MNLDRRWNQGLYLGLLAVGIFALFSFIGLLAALLVDISSELGITVPLAGQLLTVAAVVWGVAAIMIGPLSDHYGKKPIIIGGFLVFSLALLGYSLSRSFPLLILASTLTGLGGAMTGPLILAVVGDHFQPGVHGRIMGLVNAGSPLASLIGVPVGTLIAAHMGWRTSFLLLGALTLCVAFAGLFIIPHSNTLPPGSKASYVTSFRDAFRHKAFDYLMLANIFRQVAFWSLFVYLPAFLIQRYALGMQLLAFVLCIIALGQLSGMLLGGVLADRFDKIKLSITMHVLIGIFGAILVGFRFELWLVVALGALFTGLFNATLPIFFATTVSISPKLRGTIMGIQAASNHVGRSLGSMLGGLILAFFDYRNIGLSCLGLSLVSSALFFHIHYSSNLHFDHLDPES
ncbi:MAG: MFS transporter [Deltaproteobacteria bacterium]|nr:MFS transporter [Deltaproteobacteria bacterium]